MMEDNRIGNNNNNNLNDGGISLSSADESGIIPQIDNPICPSTTRYAPSAWSS